MPIRLLTRHPPHRDGESLFPYELRLTGVNGYETPGHLISFCGIRPPHFGTGIDISKLAAAANTTRAKLAEIGYRSGVKRKQLRLLGHKVFRRDLRLFNPQVCPDCIREHKFIHAHFDLAMMIACPMHGTMLVASCQECDEPLSWLRPNLLECRCGANLKTIERIPISQSARDLLDVIRRKVLGLSTPDKYPSLIPSRDLKKMKLRSLLYVIEVLGKRSPAGTLSIRERSKILLRASEALSDWPRNYFCMLEEFKEDNWDETGATFRTGGLKGFYTAMMFGVRPRKEALFLQAALSQFATSHRGLGIRRSTTRNADPLMPDRFLSRAEFAQRLGIDFRTLDRLIEENVIDVSLTRRGGVWIDLDSRDPAKQLGEWVYSAPQAAKALSIPLSVLIELKRSGFFSLSYLPVGSGGHHVLDLTEFCRILESRVQPSESGKGNMILFRHAIRNSYYTAEMKAEIVRKILKGEIPVFGQTATPLGQIKVERRLLIPLRSTESARSPSARPTISSATQADFPMIAKDVASVLGCYPQAIPHLVAEGHLKAKQKGRALWVDATSVYHFQKRYLRISSVAEDLDCSTVRLIDICLKSRIQMIVCDVAGKCRRHAFISYKHEAKLRELYIRTRN